MKVFIANDTGQRFDKAEKYGELIRLSTGQVNANKSWADLQRKFTNLIEGSSSDDFLLLAGNNLLCILAFNIWKAKHGHVKILHWNPDYAPNEKPNFKYDEYRI